MCIALTRLAFVLKQLVEATAAQYVLYVDEAIAWRRTNSENACDRRNTVASLPSNTINSCDRRN